MRCHKSAIKCFAATQGPGMLLGWLELLEGPPEQVSPWQGQGEDREGVEQSRGGQNRTAMGQEWVHWAKWVYWAGSVH